MTAQSWKRRGAGVYDMDERQVKSLTTRVAVHTATSSHLLTRSKSCGRRRPPAGNKRHAQRLYGTACCRDAYGVPNVSGRGRKQDHRRLGAELDLFSFPEDIGSGLAVFHPKGGVARRVMEDYSRTRHETGYEFVNSPHITKSQLFEKSVSRLVR